MYYRNRVVCRQLGQLGTSVDEERAGPNDEGLRSLAHRRRERGIDLTGMVLALRIWICSPMPPTADSTLFNVDSVPAALAGSTSTAIRVAPGTSSRSCSSRFAANSIEKTLIPVRLPPGRARLATRPSLTGSSPARKTMGIVVVAALAANAGETPPIVAITATCRRANSVASAGSRSI